MGRPKIYTKTGDGGETGLIGGRRVSKASARIETYGTVDELNSVIGICRAMLAAGKSSKSRAVKAVRPGGAIQGIDALLKEIQSDLFRMGAELASDPAKRDGKADGKGHGKAKGGFAPITAADATRLEKAIDGLESKVEPLRHFILPGGTAAGSILHFARCVCRRAERLTVSLSGAEPVDPHVVIYLNRLSDLLFVMARAVNAAAGESETKWEP
jgi:cob(I)alamin adenosyltransferase